MMAKEMLKKKKSRLLNNSEMLKDVEKFTAIHESVYMNKSLTPIRLKASCQDVWTILPSIDGLP